jgi:glucose/arabinose dehydrogenase
MRRIRNLAVFGLICILIVAAIGLVFGRPLLNRFFGVSFDTGPGGRADLVLPSGYTASVFAEGLSGPRFMAVSPDGVLFVAERGADRVVALPDEDADGVADRLVEVGRGYGQAHDIEFTRDGSLLVAGQATLHEVELDGLRETARRTVVGDLPVGGHQTKTVEVLPGGEILLAIGSSCDACPEDDPRRASIQAVADGMLRPHMVGLRNAVGLWVDDETGRAWATNMGRDRLGDDRPPETLYEVIAGADAGWPRCHAGEIPDPEFGTGEDPCAGVAPPAATFPAHMAPLALIAWKGHLVIAFHGSWNSSSKVGYALWWLPWDGAPAGDAEPFAAGFLPDEAAEARGRPAGLAVGADGALYVSDDKAGFIYRIAAQDSGSIRPP